MKKSLTIIVLVLMASLATAKNGNGIIKQSKGSITFVVDKNLTPVEDRYMEQVLGRGFNSVRSIFQDEGVPGDVRAVIATSFSDDEKFCTIKGKDVFFQTVVRAYAEHRPLVLSPDMMWVLVSQGFARYVNAHSEQMRHQLVSHDGKMDLVVQSEKDLLSAVTVNGIAAFWSRSTRHCAPRITFESAPLSHSISSPSRVKPCP